MNRAEVWSWYTSLLAGALPVLVAGFATSVIANRLLFVGWALGVAAAYTLLLRWGFAGDWNGWLLAGRMLLLLAAAVALYGRLLARYWEEFELGWAASFPSFFDASLLRPRTVYTASILLTVMGALQILVGHGAARKTPRPGR